MKSTFDVADGFSLLLSLSRRPTLMTHLDDRWSFVAVALLIGVLFLRVQVENQFFYEKQELDVSIYWSFCSIFQATAWFYV